MYTNYLWRGYKKIVFCLFSALEMQMSSALEAWDLRLHTNLEVTCIEGKDSYGFFALNVM